MNKRISDHATALREFSEAAFPGMDYIVIALADEDDGTVGIAVESTLDNATAAEIFGKLSDGLTNGEKN